jgi:hypothetical protein
MLQVREGALDLAGADERVRKQLLALLTMTQKSLLKKILKRVQEGRGRITCSSRALAEDEEVTTFAAGRCGGYAASFFLREARLLRATSPSLSMK